jgi:hypothetical protein
MLFNFSLIFEWLQFKMRRDESCKVVCRPKLSAEAAKNFKEKIDDEYRVNMYVCSEFEVFAIAS